MEDKPKETTAADIALIITAQFYPASSLEETTLKLTTKEIAERVKEHVGLSIAENQIYLKMKELNFLESSDSEMNFVWLLKQK